MADPAGDTAQPSDPNQSPEWLSYLMPGTTVLRTVAELTDPAAVAIFERIVSADAEAKLHQDTDRVRSLDLAHLDDIHARLFGEVYPFAGQHRYVDTQKPGQTGEPFLHHAWIRTYTEAVIAQLRAEGNLADLRDPGQWADRAAYYQAALLHSHPYREGNGRTIRVWLEDLAAEAGHQLDWTRSGHDRNNYVAIAAAHGDYEPSRALLSVVAGGTPGSTAPSACSTTSTSTCTRRLGRAPGWSTAPTRSSRWSPASCDSSTRSSSMSPATCVRTIPCGRLAPSSQPLSAGVA